jgi:hypothetical protein
VPPVFSSDERGFERGIRNTLIPLAEYGARRCHHGGFYLAIEH